MENTPVNPPAPIHWRDVIRPVLNTISAAGIIAAVALLWNTNINDAVAEQILKSLQEDMIKLEVATKDRYTNKDASSDFQVRDIMLEGLIKDVSELEEKVKELENR